MDVQSCDRALHEVRAVKTKRNHEGYVLIDNTESPGVSSQMIQRAWLAGKRTVGLFGEVASGKKLEAATITCAHCQRGVILNPHRSHSREWCSKCDHYICDNCGLVRKIDGQCRNVRQLLDTLQEQIFKQES